MSPKTSRLTARKTLVLIAIALLASSLALLVSSYRTEPLKEFLVAKRDLPSGSSINLADFDRLAMNLDERLYLSGSLAQSELAETSLSRPVRRGEIVPFSALGSTDTRQNLVLTPTQPLSEFIRVGSLVDVWFVAKTSLEAAAIPQRVGTALEVVSISRPAGDSAFAENALQLEVAVSPLDLPALILASADGGFIGVVAKR
jgi:hypothetical protein